MYDVIIIGAGCAGMNAAIYAKRSGLNVLVLDESAPGGLLNKISLVENYLGFKSTTGPDLAFSMFEHMQNEKVELKIEKVLSIKNEKEYKSIFTSKSEYKTKNIILAIGRKPRKSGITAEEKFQSNGISYCATCDGSLYKDKKVIVLGGGDSAFEESLYLNSLASSVTIIVRNQITAKEGLVAKVKENNINIIQNVEVTEFVGADKLEAIKLSTNEVIPCDGAFVYYGYMADTAFINNLNITDSNGYIQVDKNMKTKMSGVYACGDIIKKDVYQIITATAEGCIAALSIKKQMNNEN